MLRFKPLFLQISFIHKFSGQIPEHFKGDLSAFKSSASTVVGGRNGTSKAGSVSSAAIMGPSRDGNFSYPQDALFSKLSLGMIVIKHGKHL